MTQHQEAIQVHDEDAQANREAKDRAQVDSLRAELGSADSEAPHCIHFGCTNRVSWWGPKQDRYNRICDQCLDTSRNLGGQR